MSIEKYRELLDVTGTRLNALMDCAEYEVYAMSTIVKEACAKIQKTMHPEEITQNDIDRSIILLTGCNEVLKDRTGKGLLYEVN